jgi:hypothetical protein
MAGFLSFLALATMFVGGACWAISRIPARPIRYGCLTLFLGLIAVSQTFVFIQGSLRWHNIPEDEALMAALRYVFVISVAVAWFTWNRGSAE